MAVTLWQYIDDELTEASRTMTGRWHNSLTPTMVKRLEELGCTIEKRTLSVIEGEVPPEVASMLENNIEQHDVLYVTGKKRTGLGDLLHRWHVIEGIGTPTMAKRLNEMGYKVEQRTVWRWLKQEGISRKGDEQ